MPDCSSEPKGLRLLDYACGTGVVTLALASICKEAVGIDVSAKMIERYKQLTCSHAPSGLQVSCLEGNIFAEQDMPSLLQEPALYDFDIVAVGFGFHHFDSPSLCIQRLAERLRPGGTVLIIDFCAGGDHLPAKAGITSHGFSEEQMKELFEGQGLVNIGYHRLPRELELKMSEDVMKKHAFFGRAIKPI